MNLITYSNSGENTTTLDQEWAITIQILFNTFDLFGIFMKIFCIFVIKQRCDISHTVYNLMVQYLVSVVCVGIICFTFYINSIVFMKLTVKMVL